MAYRSFRFEKFSARGVRKVTTGTLYTRGNTSHRVIPVRTNTRGGILVLVGKGSIPRIVVAKLHSGALPCGVRTLRPRGAGNCARCTGRRPTTWKPEARHLVKYSWRAPFFWVGYDRGKKRLVGVSALPCSRVLTEGGSGHLFRLCVRLSFQLLLGTKLKGAYVWASLRSARCP